MPKIDTNKIRKISASKNYGHIRVSSPVSKDKVRILNANVQNNQIIPSYWDTLRKEALQAKAESLSIHDFLYTPKVIESHIAHAEALQHINILNDPKRVIKIDQDKYLYTHASIISSVNVEDDDHTIKVASIKDINKNGDAWETKNLLATYKSFIGAYNYLEHVQIPAMRKGWIVDAIPRLSKNADGSKFAIIDILVATERSHKSLISALESGELNSLSMGCFLENTPILMADGSYKNIEAVVQGDFVLTHTGNKKPVTNTFSYNIRGGVPVYTFDVSGYCSTYHKDGLFRVTGEHPALILRKEDNQCQYPPPGSTPQCKKKGLCKKLDCTIYEEPKNIVWALPEKIKAGDCMLTPVRKSKNIPQSPGLAKLLGYYVGDGMYTMYENGSGNEKPCVKIVFSPQEEHFAREVINIVKNLTGKEYSLQFRDDNYKEYILSIYNRDLCEKLLKLSGTGSRRKKLSEDIFDWSLQDKADFICGYLNSDGCLDNSKGGFQISTRSETLAIQTVQIMHQLGMVASYVGQLESKSGFSKNLSEENRVEYTIWTPKRSAVKVSKLFWGESKYITDSAVDDGTRERFFIKDSKDNVYLASRVKSTQSTIIIGTVYNFSVEDDESYVAYQHAVHNCSCKFTICSKCGYVSANEMDICQHIPREKLQAYTHTDGTKRYVAELCGHASDHTATVFEEASWVYDPAFVIAEARKRVASTKRVSPSILAISDLYQSKKKFLSAEPEALEDAPPPDDLGGEEPPPLDDLGDVGGEDAGDLGAEGEEGGDLGDDLGGDLGGSPVGFGGGGGGGGGSGGGPGPDDEESGPAPEEPDSSNIFSLPAEQPKFLNIEDSIIQKWYQKKIRDLETRKPLRNVDHNQTFHEI